MGGGVAVIKAVLEEVWIAGAGATMAGEGGWKGPPGWRWRARALS